MDRVGSRQLVLCQNLKSLKHPLKKLNSKEFGHISSRAARAQEGLEMAQQLFHDNPTDSTFRQDMQEKLVRAKFLAKAEKSFYYQKAKLHYLKDSDRGTAFFHGMARRNQKRNHLSSIIQLIVG